MKHSLIIKNMVCPRCIAAVENTLTDLDIEHGAIRLGQVEGVNTLSEQEENQLREKLQQQGFELLESGKSSIIAQIKSVIIEEVHHSEEPTHINFSQLISEKLNYEYSYLSKMFSSVEGITIEKYITKQKIEKAKELLFYDELTLSEIADRLGYSSNAYLSSQFKKETGMTPTAFKANFPDRKNIDTL